MPAKKYRKLGPRIDDALALHERVAAGAASSDEAREYQRVMNALPIPRKAFRAWIDALPNG